MELFFYHRATVIVALTEAFEQNLIARGISEEKIRVIPNGVDRTLFYPREKDAVLLEKLGLRGKFVVGYIGTHGMAHGLDFIVRAAAQLKDPSIHFLFVGDGAEKERVLKLAQEKRLQNATFLDPIPKEKVPAYMSTCDAALVPLKKSDTFKTVLPSKIFEAAALQRLIILGVEGQAKELVEKYGAGVCFEPENCGDFLKAIVELKENVGLYKNIQKGCANLAQDFQRKKLAMQMLKVIEEAAVI
jgi:glycosyltransferase involved in cell wall biosynthesis